MADPRKYTSAEVQEILRRAASKSQDTSDSLEHDDLVAAAREAGLDPAAVEAAALEVASARSTEDAGRELREQKRRGFLSHLSAYVIVNGALLLMSLLATGRPYSLTVAIGWGIGLAFHLLGALREPTRDDVREYLIEREAREQALQRVRDKLADTQRAHEARAADRARKEHQRDEKRRRKEQIEGAKDALESAVQQGVTAVLKAAASEIDARVQSKSKPESDSEFARYVREKKGGSAASAPAPASAAATGVRVDARDRGADDAQRDEGSERDEQDAPRERGTRAARTRT